MPGAKKKLGRGGRRVGGEVGAKKKKKKKKKNDDNCDGEDDEQGWAERELSASNG